MKVKTNNIMKRFIFPAILTLVCAIMPTVSTMAQVSYTRSLNDFDRIEAYGDIYCEIVKGSAQTARVEGIGISLDDLDVKVEGQTLRIQLKPRIYSEFDVKIYISYNKVREIKTAGSAVLVSADTLSGDKLTVDALTSSTVRLQVNLSNIELKAGQGATISAKGKVETLEASAGSKGLISGYDLVANKAFASCSFGGILKLHPTEYLEAKASVGGTVYYINAPKQIKVSENLGGKIESVPSMDDTTPSDTL